MDMDQPTSPDETAASPDSVGAAQGEAPLSAALECLLFMADQPLVPKDLGEMLGIEPEQVCALADRLAAEYESRGLQITRVAGGYQMCTRPEYGEFVAKLHEPRRFRLSRASMETLAIVAYRQPITRPEIEAVRGVNCDSVIETLLERGLACERGRRSTPGRPMTYGTTPEFLSQFGLNSLRDLPALPQLTAEEVEARLRAAGLAPAQEGAAADCHSEPFACHSERSEESRSKEPYPAQGKLREESRLPFPTALEEGAATEAVEPPQDAAGEESPEPTAAATDPSE